jgi:hypothetical protein
MAVVRRRKTRSACIKEGVAAVLRERSRGALTRGGQSQGNVVHTNLSEEASIGDEVWFGPGKFSTINAGSGSVMLH